MWFLIILTCLLLPTLFSFYLSSPARQSLEVRRLFFLMCLWVIISTAALYVGLIAPLLKGTPCLCELFLVVDAWESKMVSLT